jgi:hypothetical protein
MNRKRYASDITRAQYEQIKPLLENANGVPGRDAWICRRCFARLRKCNELRKTGALVFASEGANMENQA